MVCESFDSDLLPHCALFAVVAVGIDGYPSARSEFSPDLDIFRIHKLYEVFHNDVYAVLVEVSVVAERVKIKL